MLVVETCRVLPDHLFALFVDDEHRVEVAGADKDVAGPEPGVAGLEPRIRRQLADRVDVGRVLAIPVPAWEIVDVVVGSPLPHHSPPAINLLQIAGSGHLSRASTR